MPAKYDLSGRVVLITGATGGVGPTVTRGVLEAGARVALVSRSHDKLEDLAASLKIPDNDCLLHAGDLSDPGAAHDMMVDVVGCFSKLDGVVNLVGHWEPSRLTDITDEQWHGMLATNLHSIFYVMREAAPHLAEGGAVVNIGGELPLEGRGGQLAYAVSKAGVLTLTQSAALELRSRGVRVNAILPRNIDTPHNRLIRKDSDPALWVKPIEIAHLVLFLLSPEASAINGALIPAYGLE